MVPTTYEALGIILLAIVPGYIATTFWSRAKTWKGRSTDLLTVLHSLAVSVVIQVVVSPLTLLWIAPEYNELLKHEWDIAVWLTLVVLIVPVVGGSGYARVVEWLSSHSVEWENVFLVGGLIKGPKRFFGSVAPPTIWDWTFDVSGMPDGAYLIVEFNDGKRVAGEYVVPARAQTSPDPPGLFLVAEWVLDDDGDLYQRRPGSSGVMIPSTANIRLIRILKGESGGTRD